MNLLSNSEKQIKQQGEQHIWKWIAKKQEDMLSGLNEMYEKDKHGHTMPGMKCSECGAEDMRIQIERKVTAVITKYETDYLSARELQSLDKAAHIFCPVCFHKEPCDISYQVQK